MKKNHNRVFVNQSNRKNSEENLGESLIGAPAIAINVIIIIMICEYGIILKKTEVFIYGYQH